jgi:hypothetical protein
MSLLSIFSLLWPAMFVISLVPLFLMAATERGYSQRTTTTGGLIGILFFIIIYQVPLFNTTLRWILTVIGFAAPLALGVIAIQYVVEETSAPI